MASFIDNFREALRSAPQLLQPVMTIPLNAEKKEPQKAWGWEDDKSMYSDDSSDRVFEDYLIHNNDTKKDTTLRIGYDKDNKIASVGVVKDGGSNVLSYVGKDRISDFFKENFNMDADDYTIFYKENGEDPRKTGNASLLFDSSSDGAFIPSQIFNPERRVKVYQVGADNTTGEGEVTDFYDRLRNNMLKQGTSEKSPRIKENSDAYSAADNATLRPMGDRLAGYVSVKDYDEVVNNGDVFKKMVAEWSLENDPYKRRDIVNNYSTKYGFGNNTIFSDLLNGLSYYDEGQASGAKAGDDAFTLKTRMEWLKAMEENIEAAKEIYNPYRKA